MAKRHASLQSCNECPFHREIEMGLHKETPYEETPCASCPLTDPNHAPRALRGRAGCCRNSLDWVNTEIVDAFGDLRRKDPPRDHHEPAEALLRALKDAQSPEEARAVVERRWTGTGRALARKLQDADHMGDGVPIFFLGGRLADRDLKADGETIGYSAARAHSRLRALLERLGEDVKRLLIRRYSST